MTLLSCFDELLAQCQPAFKQWRTYDRARENAYASLIVLGRHTISRMICAKNKQQQDWSADYQFFARSEWNADDLYATVLSECAQHSHWHDNAILSVLDDTCRKKTGKKIPGVRTLRDPMSLPYHVNLMRALRFTQAAVIINPERRLDTVRAIPVLFDSAFPAFKPKKNAPEEVKERYQQEQKEKSLSVQGHRAALKLREQIDRLPQGKERRLFLAVDGSYCNRNFLRELPDSIVPIARARKDAKLYAPVTAKNPKGRHRIYGQALPTPEEIRKDSSYLWQTAWIYAAGKYHELHYKEVRPVLWKKGTGATPYRLIVIAPLRYRRNKNAKLLYRDPAYLLTPDMEVPANIILQHYTFRWDIEVDHRDEKSLIRVGDAQVRSEKSVTCQPQFSVFAYSLLLLAALKAYGPVRTADYLPLPKWRREETRRPSTLDILAQLRREIMLEQIQLEQELFQRTTTKKQYHCKRPKSKIEARKRGFAIAGETPTTHSKLPVNILSALLYADT